jgi:hypothetical protein
MPPKPNPPKPSFTVPVGPPPWFAGRSTIGASGAVVVVVVVVVVVLLDIVDFL